MILSILAIMISAISTVMLLRSGKALGRSAFKAGYCRGRLDQHLKIAPPEVEKDWDDRINRLPPLSELEARSELDEELRKAT